MDLESVTRETKVDERKPIPDSSPPTPLRNPLTNRYRCTLEVGEVVVVVVVVELSFELLVDTVRKKILLPPPRNVSWTPSRPCE